MGRYSLAWVSLGALGLAALASWYGLSTDTPAAAQPSDALGQPQVAVGAASGLWHPPPGPMQGPSAFAPSASMSNSIPVGIGSQSVPSAFPPDGVLQASFVAASLQALSAHGVRLNQVQVSLHTVQTTDLPAAQALSRWARSQGFSVRPPVKVLEHGGEVNWVLPIERHAVLDAAQILADGRQISARAQQTPGARYHTWQVPVKGQSTLAGAAQS